jgi:Histidine kinase/Histidine kinase-, DNA gyrase B-, and HSP90-like ATPase
MRLSLHKFLFLPTIGILWASSSFCGAATEPSDWADHLASRFSSHWRSAQTEKTSLQAELSRLPLIPITDFGGPSGFRNERQAGPNHPHYDDRWIQVQWGQPASVDWVSLVPAYQYGEHGLDPNFDIPEDFRVILIDADGKTLKVLADVRDSRSDPIRKGHPFGFRVDPPMPCSGLRIEAKRMYVDTEDWHFMAWGEIFCFQGARNVARGAAVTASDSIAAPWPWQMKYAVDESTGLGLAEIPDPSNLGIGWISLGSATTKCSVWVQVDMGAIRTCDGIRMFPPERPILFLIPGYFYPSRFVIEVSTTGQPGSYQTVFSQESVDFDNPGHHAVTLRWPKIDTRIVRVRSLGLRKLSMEYPGFIGFSELQILHEDENIALNCAVEASERTSNILANGLHFWSPDSLTDGYTSKGKIIPTREWIDLLHRRYEVDTSIRRLEIECLATTAKIRFGTATVGILFGCLAVGALIVLPVSHRRREKRNMRALRAQISVDLHDEIGSSMGSIQLLTESALNKPEVAKGRLRSILMLSTGAIASLRDIVWLLKPGSAFQNPVLGHFGETASILLGDLDCDFEHDEASSECLLARDTNRHLLMFYREALHNIVRHSKCSSIRIRTSVQNQMFRLEVADDGCGIPEQKLADPYCLYSLKERTKLLGGTLQFSSSPDQGTTLILQFPITRSNSARRP